VCKPGLKSGIISVSSDLDAPVGEKMIPLSFLDNRPTAAQKFASVTMCGAILRGTDGILKFAATATHRLPMHPSFATAGRDFD